MAETDPTWKNWGKIKPQDGLFYQDYKKRSEILGELLARSDAEVKRLRSRVAEQDADVAARNFEIETLLQENERLAEMMAKGVYIESATMRPEHYDMRTRGVGAMLLAEKLVMFFKASGGENFITSTVEMEFADPKEKERYALTVQKLDGAEDSPAEKIQRLEEKNAGLRAERDSLMDQCHGLQYRADERDGLKRRATELKAENAGLRVALGPFAEYAKLFDEWDGPTAPNMPLSVDIDYTSDLFLQVQDFRRARAALGGEPASFVLVPRHLLEPFVRIASELEACETSRKMPDSAPLSAPMENIPVVGAYISLGDVRELARIAGGNPSESPIRSEEVSGG